MDKKVLIAIDIGHVPGRSGKPRELEIIGEIYNLFENTLKKFRHLFEIVPISKGPRYFQKGGWEPVWEISKNLKLTTTPREYELIRRLDWIPERISTEEDLVIVVISLHANAYVDTGVRGTEVWISKDNVKSQELAELLCTHIVKAGEKAVKEIDEEADSQKEKVGKWKGRGVKEEDPGKMGETRKKLMEEGVPYDKLPQKTMAILHKYLAEEAGIPAGYYEESMYGVLVEFGFYTNYKDLRVMKDPIFQRKVVEAMVEAVLLWLPTLKKIE